MQHTESGINLPSREAKRRAAKERRDRDVERYVARLQRKKRRILNLEKGLLLVSVVVLTVGIVANIGIGITNGAGALALFTIGTVVWSSRKLRDIERQLRQSADGRLVAENTVPVGGRELPIAALEPDETDRALGFEALDYSGERIFASQKINQALRYCVFRLVEDRRKRRQVEDYIERDKAFLVQIIHLKSKLSEAEDSEFFDDDKFCLARNLDIQKRKAYYHKGSYFDSFLTNELCSRRFESSYALDRDFRDSFPALKSDDGRNVVATLSQSGMDDHVGISTLARTRDGFLVMWVQSGRAEQSRRLCVPSGSGSADYSDMRLNTLNATIEYAMQREVTEETLLKGKGYAPENIGYTRLLGFFRWVRRGGKPEFTGFTRLLFSADDLWPDWTELETDKAAHFRVSCQTVDQLPPALKRIAEWPHLSVPLAHIVRTLQHLLAVDPAYVTDFWFRNG